MSYVDGFVMAVPKKNLAAYKRLARRAGKVWIEHGALAYVETVGDDLPKPSSKKGPLTYARMVQAKKTDLIVFSWIVYRSRASRDRVMKRVLADPRLAGMADPAALPFDVDRMAWGGFKPLVEL